MSYDSFSLILGGRSARELVHIGVIRRLEEPGVRPNQIIGTSMGALVGAFYACGYSSEEMEKIAEKIKIFSFIDRGIFYGWIHGGEITAFLRQYLGDTTFSEACIPLSLVATNFDTGEKVILQEGKIIDWVRASISIPWLMRPHNLDNSPLVDGSISSNLAIECVSNNDKIIAVSVLLPLSRPLKKQGRVAHIFSFLTHNSLMLSKFVSLMMHQNEKLSRRSRSDVLCIEVKKAWYKILWIQPCKRAHTGMIWCWYMNRSVHSEFQIISPLFYCSCCMSSWYSLLFMWLNGSISRESLIE